MSHDAWMTPVIEHLHLEDLPEGYRQIAEAIGIEAAIALSQHFGGLALYVPQVEAILRKKRDEMIRAEFNGRNHRALAIKYGLTEVWIRDIVDRKPPQQSLF